MPRTNTRVTERARNHVVEQLRNTNEELVAAINGGPEPSTSRSHSEARRNNQRFRYYRSFRNVMQGLGVDVDEYGTHERVAYYFFYRAMRDLEHIIREEYPR